MATPQEPTPGKKPTPPAAKGPAAGKPPATNIRPASGVKPAPGAKPAAGAKPAPGAKPAGAKPAAPKAANGDQGATGITTVARSIGAAMAPTLAGYFLAHPTWIDAPFYVAGGVKIAFYAENEHASLPIVPTERYGTFISRTWRLL